MPVERGIFAGTEQASESAYFLNRSPSSEAGGKP